MIHGGSDGEVLGCITGVMGCMAEVLGCIAGVLGYMWGSIEVHIRSDT